MLHTSFSFLQSERMDTCNYVQPLTVDKTDLRTGLCDEKWGYINCMEFLARRDDVVSRELKPGDTKERVILVMGLIHLSIYHLNLQGFYP